MFSCYNDDIPKIYISISWSFTTREQMKEYFDYENEKMAAAGKDAPFDIDEGTFYRIEDNNIAECAKLNESKGEAHVLY